MRSLMAAAVVLPLLVTAAGAWLSWKQAWREAERETAHAADAAAEYAGRVFEGLLLRLERAGEILAGLSDEELRAREAELHAALRRSAATRFRAPEQRGPYVFVYDRNAFPLVAGSVFPVPATQSFANREFNQALRGPQAPQLHVSPVYVGTVTGEPFFALTVRREPRGGSGTGEYDGVMNASVYVAEAEAALRRLASDGMGDVLALVRDDGQVLARSLSVPPGTRLAEDSPMLAAMRRNADSSMLTLRSSLDGELRIAAYRRVAGYPVYASAARSRSAIVNRWAAGVAPLLAAGVPATLALLGLALLVVRKQRALHIANDDLEARVDRRTAELRTSEARLQELVATLDLGHSLTRDMAGNIRSWSKGCTSLFGWTAEEAVGRHAHELLQTYTSVPRRDMEAALLRDGAWQGDMTRRARDGREIVVNAQKALRRDSDGQPLAVLEVLTDVTAHRATETALAESERRLRLAQDAGRVGTWDWDISADRLQWSVTCHELHGTDPTQPITCDQWLWGIDPEEGSAVERRLRDLLAGPENEWSVVLPYRRRTDGERRWLSERGEVFRDADGVPLRMMGVTLDVTEQREAEATLRASEERARLATEAARLGTWEFDAATATYGWSERLSEIMGDAPAPRRGVSVRDFLSRIHPDDVVRVQDSLRRASQPGSNGHILVEYRVRAPDRSWRWLSVRGAVLSRDPATGAAASSRGVVLDVTDRKLAETRQQLLVREVDHRAKNALAVVLAAVRLADRTDADAFATAIEGRVGAMARTHGLLAESRWTGADLCALAKAELAPFIGTKLADGPELPRVQVTGPTLHVDAEAAQAFSMVLHELATNATKYGALSVAGGVVRVELLVDDEDGKVRLQWSERNGPTINVPPSHQGFGTQVIEAIVEGQLGGSVVRDWSPEGLSCAVTVSLERVLPAFSAADKLVAINVEQAQESASQSGHTE